MAQPQQIPLIDRVNNSSEVGDAEHQQQQQEQQETAQLEEKNSEDTKPDVDEDQDQILLADHNEQIGVERTVTHSPGESCGLDTTNDGTQTLRQSAKPMECKPALLWKIFFATMLLIIVLLLAIIVYRINSHGSASPFALATVATDTTTTPREGLSSEHTSERPMSMAPTSESITAAKHEQSMMIKVALNMSAVPPCQSGGDGSNPCKSERSPLWISLVMKDPPYMYALAPLKCVSNSISRATTDGVCETDGPVYRWNGTWIQVLRKGFYDVTAQITARCVESVNQSPISVRLSVNESTEILRPRSCPADGAVFTESIAISLSLNPFDRVGIALSQNKKGTVILEISSRHTNTFVQLAMR